MLYTTVTGLRFLSHLPADTMHGLLCLCVLHAGICVVPYHNEFDDEFDMSMHGKYDAFVAKSSGKFADRLGNKQQALLGLDLGHVRRLQQQHQSRAAAHAQMQKEAVHFTADSMLCTPGYAAAQKAVEDADKQICALLTGALQCRLDEVTEMAIDAVRRLQNHAVNATVPMQLPKEARDSVEKQKWLLLRIWEQGVEGCKRLMREAYSYVDDGYMDDLGAECCDV